VVRFFQSMMGIALFLLLVSVPVFALDSSILSTKTGTPLTFGEITGTKTDFTVDAIPKIAVIGEKSSSIYGEIEVVDSSVGISGGQLTLKIPYFNANIFGVAVVSVPGKQTLPISDLKVEYGLMESWTESEPVFGWVNDKVIVITINDKNGEICPKNSKVLSTTTCEVITQIWKQTGTQSVSKSGIVWGKTQAEIMNKETYVRTITQWQPQWTVRLKSESDIRGTADLVVMYGDW